MTPEMIAILAVGVALAGLMLHGHQGLGMRTLRTATSKPQPNGSGKSSGRSWT